MPVTDDNGRKHGDHTGRFLPEGGDEGKAAPEKTEKSKPGTDDFVREADERTKDHVAAYEKIKADMLGSNPDEPMRHIVREFYNEKLKGKAFDASFGDLGNNRVQFIGSNFGELSQWVNSLELKADLFPHLTEVLQTGKYLGGREAPQHKPPYKKFHSFYKEVMVKRKGETIAVKVIIDVAELSNNEFAYHLNHEGYITWNTKLEHLKRLEESGELKHGVGIKKALTSNAVSGLLPAQRYIINAFENTVPQGNPEVNEKLEALAGQAVAAATPTPTSKLPISNTSEENVTQDESELNLFIIEAYDAETGERFPELSDIAEEESVPAPAAKKMKYRVLNADPLRPPSIILSAKIRRFTRRRIAVARAVKPSRKVTLEVNRILKSGLEGMSREAEAMLGQLNRLLPEEFEAIMGAFQEKWRSAYGEKAEELARRWVAAVREQSKAEFRRTLSGALGLDIAAVLEHESVRAAAEEMKAQAARLIVTIPEEYLGEVGQAAWRHYQGMAQPEGRTLTEQIQHIGSVSESRAELIARDQTSKINTAVTRARNEEAGIDEYIWRTVKDGRVVGNPAGLYPVTTSPAKHGNHYAREGKRFRWDNPPADGHPGYGINCRCVAEPVINMETLNIVMG